MTKSRRLPALLFLALTGLAFPAAAQTQALPPPIIAAPPDPLGDLAARQRAGRGDCLPGSDDGIVVCGRRARLGGGGYRVPYEPEPGAPVRLIAGEPPSATGAMDADHCTRLCDRPVMVNLLDPGSIARGLDRILGGN